jgi:diguanylate cyclase (GGDEF)-like protein
MRRFSLKPRRLAEPSRGLAAAALLVVVFVALASIIRLTSIRAGQLAMFWPADGALVVAMLILPSRRRLAVLACCFGFNVILDLQSKYPLLQAFGTSTLNILVSYLVAVLTRWRCGAATDLSRSRRLAVFAPIAFLSAGVEAAFGESVFPVSRSPLVAMHDALQWTLCDGLGLLLATPAILLWFKPYRHVDQYPASPLERWLLVSIAAAFTASVFLFLQTPFFVLIFPLLLLTAFRAGPAWVMASILITALIASGLTAHGYGPFTSLSMGRVVRAQDLLQMFLVAIFLTAAPANNALGEQARAARRLLHLKSRLEHSATHDALTGLANRGLLKSRLSNTLASGEPCALIFVDLDRFKQVNDTMGHPAGDELLRTFGARLLGVTGPSLTVARLGGDEFAILVHGAVDPADQEALCGRINDLARTPFSLADGPAHVSACIGLASSPDGGLDVSELMRRADVALYAAKAAPGDGYRIYDDALDQSTRDKAAMEADLRGALEAQGQLQLHYQPKVDADGVIRGVEALVRWRHPTRGQVPVDRLIALAEETGLIVPLGAWVLREALAFAGRWPHLAVAINVSAGQLRAADFIADVLAAYHGAPVAYGRLELEVTEYALMDDIAVVSGKLAALRGAGIRIALDDFGTGYSSLRHLHRCPVDRVKIDRSFVRGLDGGNQAAAIVKAIIQLGHALGLEVTAEGVETAAQHRFLLEAGVDELQGFLFSRPLDDSAFESLMRDGSSAGAGAGGAPRRYALLTGGLAT